MYTWLTFSYVGALIFLCIVFCLPGKIHTGMICIFTKRIVVGLLGCLTLIFAIVAFYFTVNFQAINMYATPNGNYTHNKPQYVWLNAFDIVRFPLDQLRIHNRPECTLILSDINSGIPQKPKKRKNYVIVVDRTLSTKSVGNYKGSKELKAQRDNASLAFANNVVKRCTNNRESNGKVDINKYINPESNLTGDSLFAADYVAIGIIERLYALQDKKDFTYKVILYNGSSARKNTYNDFFEVIPDENVENGLCVMIQQYSKNKKIANREITDFKKVIDNLNTDNSIKADCDNILIIISDFFHEQLNSGVSFRELQKSTNSFMQNKIQNINQISLVVVTGDPKNDAQSIENTTLLFDHSFKNIYTYHYSQDILLENDDSGSYINFISMPTFRDTINNLIFYHPYQQGKHHDANKTFVKFDSVKNHTRIMMAIRDENDSSTKGKGDYSITLKEGAKTIGAFSTQNYVNELICLADDYEFILDSPKDISSNLFIELASERSNEKIQIPILLRELVSKHACYTLIALYSIFIICITSIYIYLLGMFSKNCNSHIKTMLDEQFTTERNNLFHLSPLSPDKHIHRLEANTRMVLSILKIVYKNRRINLCHKVQLSTMIILLIFLIVSGICMLGYISYQLFILGSLMIWLVALGVWLLLTAILWRIHKYTNKIIRTEVCNHKDKCPIRKAVKNA